MVAAKSSKLLIWLPILQERKKRENEHFDYICYTEKTKIKEFAVSFTAK